MHRRIQVSVDDDDDDDDDDVTLCTHGHKYFIVFCMTLLHEFTQNMTVL